MESFLEQTVSDLIDTRKEHYLAGIKTIILRKLKEMGYDGSESFNVDVPVVFEVKYDTCTVDIKGD